MIGPKRRTAQASDAAHQRRAVLDRVCGPLLTLPPRDHLEVLVLRDLCDFHEQQVLDPQPVSAALRFFVQRLALLNVEVKLGTMAMRGLFGPEASLHVHRHGFATSFRTPRVLRAFA